MVANLRHKNVIYFFFILLLSCNQEKNTNDHLIFRYNEHSNITSLDPIFAKDQRNIWACNQLYNGLVQLDDNLNIKPDIAKHWTVDSTGTKYTFQLRNDVYFHENQIFGTKKTRTVVAKDFEYSLNRLCKEEIASPGSWVVQNVFAVEAIDQHTLSIELKEPFPAFLGTLTMKFCSVVPEEAVNYYKEDFSRNPVGTGPFKFKKWLENTKLVFRKNEQYFEVDKNGNQLPYLEAIAITFLPDKQSEFLQFAQGNLDFISGLDPSYKDELLTSKGILRDKYNSTVNMISGPYLNTEYLGFYMESNVTEVQSELIRQAVNYGFDRRKMITYLRNGIGIPAENGFIPKGLPGFNNLEGYTYRPDRAKELIAQFKRESGIKNPTLTISTNSAYVDLCEYIQRELETLGLTVDIDLLTPSTLRQEKANGKLDCFRASWIADYPDAENYLSLFYSKNFAPNGPNYMHFSSREYDEVYEEALRTPNPDERVSLYQKLDSIIIDKASVVPLYYDQVTRFTNKNVNGMTVNPINLLNLKRVSKKPVNE